MNKESFTYYAERTAVIALLAGITWLVMIIVTAPDRNEKPEDSIGGDICITDDAPEYVAFGIPYDELFPPGYEYGKDGEIITDPLPKPTTRHSTDPDKHIGYPTSPWIAQSMAGQTPPVLYWPAPAYRQTVRKSGKPCADKYKPVAEPGILALIGAALLAAGVMR
ncbi:hypothetical protein ABO04_05150 [Nitrosomonas sp. HPC101]|uniref:hypothetical protein n=1 Tax=Nitrosomonas sp. HPC101 TaxID=1658667 RepID=UPI00136A82E2|nr:hypothetical protein [Nitrosomonas sp. HPC101]MXS85321.1 hypothetical protein [Nitrosomonas sp. HPC101]